MANENQPQQTAGVTWAQAARDIVIASINKGQLPLVIFGAVLLLLVWKMPEKDTSPLIDRLVDAIENWHLMGYLLFLITLAAWFAHAGHQRRIMAKEIHRLSEERSRLQQETLGDGVESSGGR